jgi:hypothetical protein
MVNSVKNDRGEFVTAIGAPGSEARVRVEYPALVEKLNKIYWQCYETYGKGQDIAIEAIREAGIKDHLTTNSLMAVSYYGKDENIGRYWLI